MWIRLKNIQVFAYHGAYEHEQKFGNKFELDVEIEADLDNAAKADSLQETIDYAKVLEFVLDFSKAERYNLLEAWAYQLALAVSKAFPLAKTTVVRIRKQGGAVGGLLDSVEIERRR